MQNKIPFIKSGKILVYRLYDVANEIDLLKVENRIKKDAKRLKITRRPFSKAFEFANPPLSFELKGFDKEINNKKYRANVYCKVYDFGVLGIIFEFALSDLDVLCFEDLAISIDRDEYIDIEFRGYLNQVVTVLEGCFTGFNISRFKEDYTIFFIERFSPELEFEDFLSSYNITSLMFSEKGNFSEKISEELVSSRSSYYKNDGIILNWDNALIVEPSGSMEIPDLLEFANAQLLELRYYDHIVDSELAHIQDSITEKGSLSIWKIKKYERLAAKIMQTITELTEITEKIDTSLKVTEDVYYAKVYMEAINLFKVKEWERNIKKKLDIASNACDMLYREISNKRLELLELAIVILIMIDIIIWIIE